MEWEGKKYAIDNEQILLRGAVLRNTSWCYGVVIFAGKDTKLMQNSGKAKFKRTSIDRLLNFIILGVSISYFPAMETKYFLANVLEKFALNSRFFCKIEYFS